MKNLNFIIRFATVFAAIPAVLLSQDSIQFSRDIQPILSEKCYHCHGPDENSRESDLRLDTRDGIFAKGSENKIVAPGNLEKSDLYQRIVSDDESLVMPPPESKLSLSAEQKEKIRNWIESGGKWEKLWSLIPPTKSTLPTIKNRSWAKNEIDFFIAATIEQNKLSPADQASKEKMLRRVYLDLIGLPPSGEDLKKFLADDSPIAYELVVERLLASPLYGERMAWPWLDAARYADSNGFQGDRERTMWPWRDWVIESLNENMPYNEFTTKQIAGDLLTDATDRDQLATGFCRNHMINGEGGRIAEENRAEYIFDQLETVGTVWLGLTFNCCRCHDHKYDPLLQKDYYSMFAIFNNTPVTGGGGDPATPPKISYPSQLQRRQLKMLEPDLAKYRKEVIDHELQIFARDDGQPISESPDAKKLADNIQKALTVAVSARNSKQLESLEKQFAKSEVAYSASLKKLRKISDQYNSVRGAFPQIMVMADTKQRKTFRLDRGLYNQPKEEVKSDLPTVFGSRKTKNVNRLTLSKWLVDRKNPLVSRVTVNRNWQLFFGTGLVKTPEDFGSQGSKPSHPRLLDWLAVEFIESGWDVKALHRKIVTSATYRQSALVNHSALELDPDNRLLSYSPRFRMPAWMLRDQALYVSGLMDRTLGGKSVNPYQPQGIWADATFNKKTYQQDHGSKLYRRSLYTFWRRIVGPTMLFDVAKRQNCEVKVSRTNSPLHALVTMNDTTFVEAARVMADKLQRASENIETQISEAFIACTSRRPTASELTILKNRYEKTLAAFRESPQNANAVIDVGETKSITEAPNQTAALANVCLLILNLDESLTK